MIRQENVLKRQGAEISTLFRKANIETEQSMVSLAPRKQPLRDLRETFRNGQPEG
jgi:hypothetical protein